MVSLKNTDTLHGDDSFTFCNNNLKRHAKFNQNTENEAINFHEIKVIVLKGEPAVIFIETWMRFQKNQFCC